MKISKRDYQKAVRKGNRDSELENQTGWTAKNKKHKTVKDYTRNPKHKNREL